MREREKEKILKCLSILTRTREREGSWQMLWSIFVSSAKKWEILGKMKKNTPRRVIRYVDELALSIKRQSFTRKWVRRRRWLNQLIVVHLRPTLNFEQIPQLMRVVSTKGRRRRRGGGGEAKQREKRPRWLFDGLIRWRVVCSRFSFPTAASTSLVGQSSRMIFHWEPTTAEDTDRLAACASFEMLMKINELDLSRNAHTHVTRLSDRQQWKMTTRRSSSIFLTVKERDASMFAMAIIIIIIVDVDACVTSINDVIRNKREATDIGRCQLFVGQPKWSTPKTDWSFDDTSRERFDCHSPTIRCDASVWSVSSLSFERWLFFHHAHRSFRFERQEYFIIDWTQWCADVLEDEWAIRCDWCT